MKSSASRANRLYNRLDRSN